MKRPGQLVIWPADIDSSLTRGEGRKLVVSRAVKQPNLTEISKAAGILGYTSQIVEKASLPKSTWKTTGYLVVKKIGPRQVVLKNIASEIVKIRQRDQAAQQLQQQQKKK